jgi:hypothetical protein
MLLNASRARSLLVACAALLTILLLGASSAPFAAASNGYDGQIHGYDGESNSGANAVQPHVCTAMPATPGGVAGVGFVYDPPRYRYATNTLSDGLRFADEGAQGFGSMSSFRRAYGSAGPDTPWHHIVEQNPTNLTQFGAESIHNTSNILALDTAIHRQVSGSTARRCCDSDMGTT